MRTSKGHPLLVEAAIHMQIKMYLHESTPAWEKRQRRGENELDDTGEARYSSLREHLGNISNPLPDIH